MAITFDCPHCRKSLTTGEDKAGLTAKCPGCGQAIQVPETSSLANLIDDDIGDDAPSDSEPPRTRACPMCGAENSAQAPRCHACGEPFPEPRLRTGEPKTLELGRTMSLAWEIFKDHLPVTVGTVLLIQIGMVVWIYGAMIGVFVLIAAIQEQEEIAFVVAGVAGLFAIVSFLGIVFLLPGYTQVLLHAVRGEEYTFGTVFSGGRFFLSNLLATAVFAAGSGVGTAACIIPGIILSLIWWAYLYFLVDDDMPALASLSRSKDLMAGRWADVFLIGFIGSLLNGAIASACCFAGVFSQAYFGVLMTVVYVKLRGEDTFVERPRRRRAEAPPIDGGDDERED